MNVTSPFAFTSTQRVLSHCAPDVEALPHVTTLLNSFVDPSSDFDLPSAARTGSLQLFDHVVKSVDIPHEERGRSPLYARAMEAAISSGSLTIVQRIHHHHPEPLPAFPVRTAVRHGHVEILAWLFANRHDEMCAPRPPVHYPQGSLRCCVFSLMRLAVDEGQPRVVRWLAEQGYTPPQNTESLASRAASEGDLEMIKWLHSAKVSFTCCVMDAAARNGHIDIVEFLHHHRKEGCSTLALTYAMVNKHEAVTTYLREARLCSHVDEDIITEAAGAGRVDLLEQYAPMFVHDDDARLLRKALACALMAQRQPVLEWLHREKHVRGMPVAMAISESSPNLDVFQWIHDNDCGHWANDVLKLTIKHGHKELLEWLHADGRDEHDGPRSWMVDDAATYGHFELVQLLHNLYPNQDICTDAAIHHAAARGHLNISKWLFEHRTEGCSPFALISAISAGQREAAR